MWRESTEVTVNSLGMVRTGLRSQSVTFGLNLGDCQADVPDLDERRSRHPLVIGLGLVLRFTALSHLFYTRPSGC